MFQVRLGTGSNCSGTDHETTAEKLQLNVVESHFKSRKENIFLRRNTWVTEREQKEYKILNVIQDVTFFYC